MTKAPPPHAGGDEANGQTHTPDFNTIPAELRNARRWLVRRGKIPFYVNGKPRSGELDSPEDTARLGSFDEAIAALESGKFSELGFALGEGFACIDIDGVLNDQGEIIAGHAGAGIAREAQSLGLWMEKSQSGRGLHIFGHAERLSNVVTPKVELYAGKRFIALTGKTFANASGWGSLKPLTTMLPKRPEAANDSSESELEGFEVDFLESYASPETIEHLRDALRKIPADDRDTWQRMGHALKVLADKGKNLWLEWSATCPEKFDHADALRVWKSFRPTQTGFRAVFAEAARYGWANPARSKSPPSIQRGPLLRPVGAMLETPPVVRHLIEPILEDGVLAMLFGDPASGKSFITLDWAAAIATGRNWRNGKVRSGPVIYIAGEGHAGLSRRLKAWETHHGASLADAPLFISTRVVPFLDSAAVRNLTDEIDALPEPPVLIIVDTVSRALAGANENDQADASGFVAACDELRARYKCALLLVHHSGHGDKRRARGSSVFRAALDAEYSLSCAPDGMRTLTCTKSKDSEPPAPMNFKLQDVVLPWFNPENGECLKSAVLVNAENQPIIRRPNGRWQFVAWEGLDAYAIFGETPTRDQIIAAALKMTDAPAEGVEDRRREYISRAITQLVEKGSITPIDGDRFTFAGQVGV